MSGASVAGRKERAGKSRRDSQLGLGPMEVNSVARDRSRQDNELALVRRCLREAITESGWKHEAVAAAMTEKNLGFKVDGPYLAKMLSEGPEAKPISALHLRSLPDIIERLYARKYAESFNQIVVDPVDEVTAQRHLVSGLYGLLAHRRAVNE